MTKEEFDNKYKDKGGLKMLEALMSQGFTAKFIAGHFGVTRYNVSLWSQEFWKKNYDPRIQRKERVINAMLKFAINHPFEEFKDAYYFSDRHYYEEALAEAITRGLYKL